MRIGAALVPSVVYDTFWRFAAERQSIYHRRFLDPVGPWTDDPILRQYRFTNAYRAADRVTQYLIKEVQYRDDRSQAPGELFFRTLLFKLFNRVETWELLEAQLGPIAWQSADFGKYRRVLDAAKNAGGRIYSAAYIMPSPRFGHDHKHLNHLASLWRMMDDGVPGRVAAAHGLQDIYRLLLDQQGLGPFLAFQYAIDLNYSTMTDLSESGFVVAGPGALDGIAKCFTQVGGMTPEAVIHHVTDRQEEEFALRGLTFDGLFGRPLQPIDCQNLFCEIAKYARVAHPEMTGASGRTRIKQRYRPTSVSASAPFFPPKWHINVPRIASGSDQFARRGQLQML